jgi:hypothetical protein
VAAAVWNSATAGHVAAGTFGKLLGDLVTAVAALPALIAAVPAAVWSYTVRRLTQSAEAVAATLVASTITIRRGDTVTVTLTGLGPLTGRSKLWITGKQTPTQIDAAALFQIEETAGLVYSSAETADEPTHGSLTVIDETTGSVEITLHGEETAAFGKLTDGVYDVQILEAAGPRTVAAGTLVVTLDVTRATE